MEFKEITKRDAEVHLAQALDKLRRTGAGMGCLVGEQADIVDRDFDGFKRLFANYLNAAAKTGIDWNKIEPLPEGSVRANNSRRVFNGLHNYTYYNPIITILIPKDYSIQKFTITK